MEQYAFFLTMAAAGMVIGILGGRASMLLHSWLQRRNRRLCPTCFRRFRQPSYRQGPVTCCQKHSLMTAMETVRLAFAGFLAAPTQADLQSPPQGWASCPECGHLLPSLREEAISRRATAAVPHGATPSTTTAGRSVAAQAPIRAQIPISSPSEEHWRRALDAGQPYKSADLGDA